MTSTELKHQAHIAKWTELIKECRRSGLLVKTWCKQAQIAPSAYYRRERNVLASAETNCHSEKTTFAEVPVSKLVSRNVSTPSTTLRINEASLDIYARYDMNQLKLLVEILKAFLLTNTVKHVVRYP